MTPTPPALMSYRIFPLVRIRPGGYARGATTCPATLLAYNRHEEQAYCRAWGIPWYPRSKPEVPERGPHPRSACRDLPGIPGAHRPLSFQVRVRFIGAGA